LWLLERQLTFQIVQRGIYFFKVHLFSLQECSTLGDAVMTTAVLDRLLHKCEIFNIGGDSWRMAEQQTILGSLIKGGKIQHA
jgi:DNA replication protein DnaC